MINFLRIILILILFTILKLSNKLNICKKCNSEIKLICISCLWFLQDPILGFKIITTIILGEIYLSYKYKRRG